MKTMRILVLLAAVSSLHVVGAAPCFAQKDPEAAARQAQIDADEARSQIKDLQEEQAGFADVQNQDTTEMMARDAQIGELKDELSDAERRRRLAEEEQRSNPGVDPAVNP